MVVDADGNVVSMTTTVESMFGSGRTVGGFVLNNQLTDFAFEPTDGRAQPVANAVQGGKRPRSSMAPVIVLDHDAATSSPRSAPPAARRSSTTTPRRWSALLAWKLSLQQAIELPNLIARGDTFSGETRALLRRRCWPACASAASSSSRGVRRTPACTRSCGMPDGTYEGAADSRREGVARMLPPPQKPMKRAVGAN